MACGRRSCSTGRDLSSRRSDRRYGHPSPWQKSPAVRNAQHDHPPIPERDEAVIEVGGRDRDVLTKAHRVVLVHPGVVARLCGSVLEALEARAWVLVVQPFGAVVASCGGSIERTLAFT